MKKYIFLIAAAAIGLMTACQKLDREYITDLTDKNFIDQSYAANMAEVTAIYVDLPEGFTNIGGAMMASATDEAEFTSETSSVQRFNTGSWNAASNPDDVWGKYYKTIRRANQYLSSNNNVNLDQFKLDQSASSQLTYTTRLAEIKRWKYEVRCLRALYYFELIKRYGGVPLITKVLTADDIPSVKRNTLADCVQFISDECDSAANNLPIDYTLIGGTTVNYGRVTKVVALSIKSRLLLYAASDLFNTPSWAAGYTHPEFISLPAGDRNTRWKAAADASKAVIDLVPNPALGAYNTLFNNFNLPEIILAKRNNGPSNTFETTNTPVGYDSGNSGNTPSQDLVDAYEMKTTGKPITDVTSGYDPNNPYLNRDPRLGFSIITNGSTFKSLAVQLYTGGNSGKPKALASKTGYYIKKYEIESLNLLLNATGQHSWIIFRFPEIYLNYAEALNEYNPGDPNIKIYVDKIRARTGVALPGLPTGLSQSAMRDRIRNERRVELAFEDHRFWDTRRWMTAPTTLGAPIRGVDINKTGTNTYTYSPNIVEQRSFVASKMYLYPIPLSELNISAGLVQNPGW